MKSFIVALSLTGTLFLSGCGPTIAPRDDFPIPKYNGEKLEFMTVRGYIDDEVLVGLKNSDWKEVARIPGYGGFSPSYVLMKEKK